jgi:hypothetical protein
LQGHQQQCIYFDRFLTDYEERFEKEDGLLWPIINEVVERYLDCGNPRRGLLASAVQTAARRDSLCFSAAPTDIAHHVVEKRLLEIVAFGHPCLRLFPSKSEYQLKKVMVLFWLIYLTGQFAGLVNILVLCYKFIFLINF